MKYYAVIDTNVLVSALLKENSVPEEIIKYVIKDVIVPVLNVDILKEYQEVITREKLHFKAAIIESILKLFQERGIFAEKTEINELFEDKSDAVFYQITMSSRATKETYLITGNTRHFPKKPYVVTPRKMLDIIEKVTKDN